MSNVLVAGSINMDLVVTAERYPLSGETVPGKNLYFSKVGRALIRRWLLQSFLQAQY
jgi:sugar/nucleoside kinase (ribokinase family)